MNSDLKQLKDMVAVHDPARDVTADPRARAAVLEQIIATKAPAARPARSGRRLRVAMAVGVSAAAMAVGLPVVMGSGGPHANAVERDADGSIRIYIREYKDPNGLERKLRALGVNAVVDFVPADQHCAEPRARYAPHDPRLTTLEPPRDGASGFTRLHPDRIKPGQTLVFEVAYQKDPKNRFSIDRARLATGSVAPCHLAPGGIIVGGVHGEPGTGN